jgi:hypothetical protein
MSQSKSNLPISVIPVLSWAAKSYAAAVNVLSTSATPSTQICIVAEVEVVALVIDI